MAGKEYDRDAARRARWAAWRWHGPAAEAERSCIGRAIHRPPANVATWTNGVERVLIRRPSLLARSLLGAAALPLLAGCAAIGLAATEALVAAGVVGTAAAVAAGKPEPSRLEVRGNFGDEHGYWFDRELYGVWVVSDSPEESQRHARAVATEACAGRGKSLRIIESNAWQERALFIPVKLDRFSCEIRFRCGEEPAKLP